MSVKAIDRGTVHKICSGQVVLSLAVAVKELVENSLDAGASSIEVRLKEHGSELVEVLDNGSGVEAANFQALTLKHHTSKLRQFSDLEAGVATFGFRGEALSSLCALSDVVVTTCHKSSTVGTKLCYDSGGHISSQSSSAREVGTTVTLHRLFHTLPVRHKEFTRNLKKEYARMVQILQGYCLISTGVRISCWNQAGKSGKRQLVVATNGSTALRDNVLNVFGAKQVQQLVEVVQCSPEEAWSEEGGVAVDTLRLFKLTGFISRCNHGYGRSAGDRQFWFFNNRPVEHSKLAKAVNEVYHAYNRHQYPFVLLNITTARENVDVNLTPDKRQVLLHQERTLLLLVKASLVKIFEPMQRQFDHSAAAAAPGGSPLTPQSAPGTPTLSRLSLKRSFSLSSSPESREPDAKQAKLFEFGVTTSPLPPTPELDESPLTTKNLSPTAPSNGSKPSSPSPPSPPSPVKDTSNSSHHSMDESNTNRIDATTALPHLQQTPLHLQQSTTLPFKTPSPSTPGTSSLSGPTSVLTASIRPLDLHVPKYSPLSSAGTSKTASRLTTDRHTSLSSDYTPTSSEWSSFSLARLPVHPDKRGCGGVTVVTDEDVAPAGESLRTKPAVVLTFDLAAVSARLQSHSSGGGNGDGGRERQYGGAAGGIARFRTKISSASSSEAEEELRKEIRKSDFKAMEVVGQFNLGFIIARLDSNLFIIDQHASDEKYRFETLQRETSLQHQRLLQPISLELTAVNETVLMENLRVFEMNGFRFLIQSDAPPTKRVKLTAHPVSKGWSLGPTDIDEMIFMLTDSGPGEVVRPSAVRTMFASRACRSAVMIGTALNHSEMKKVLSHMAEIEQPWNCPHGRPVMRHLLDLSRLS